MTFLHSLSAGRLFINLMASSQSSKQPMAISGFCTTWKNAVINLPSSGLMNSKYRISWVKVDATQVIFKSKSF
jgi:hypothetical protein